MLPITVSAAITVDDRNEGKATEMLVEILTESHSIPVLQFTRLDANGNRAERSTLRLDVTFPLLEWLQQLAVPLQEYRAEMIQLAELIERS